MHPDKNMQRVVGGKRYSVATASGRPTYYGQPMRQTAIWLPEEMITWLKAQPGTMSETIRELIQKAMDQD